MTTRINDLNKINQSLKLVGKNKCQEEENKRQEHT